MGMFGTDDLQARLNQALWLSKQNPSFGYGQRNLDKSEKGVGYFGPIPNPNGGESTEVSSFDSMAGGEYPLLVPTLTQEEIQSVLNGNPLDSVYEKASRHAELRKTVGMNPFANPLDAILKR